MMHTLGWVDVDTGPVDGYRTAVDEAGRVHLDHPYTNLPEPYRTALLALVDDFDGASCQSNGCPAENVRADASPAPVGYTLHEYDDGRATQAWHFTSLVQVGETVLRVCEECSPSSLYHKD